MPGNQLVPYDPDYVPRYQVPKPSRLERFHDVMEALLVDGKGQELGAVIKAVAVAVVLAFGVTAVVYLAWAMQVGIVTGRGWTQDPGGPFSAFRAFLWWWFLETWQFWRALALLAAGLTVALVRRPAVDLYVKFLRARRRQREDAEAEAARRVREYQDRVAAVARQEQAARDAEANAVRALHDAYRRRRAETLVAINREIRGMVARERINAMSQGIEEDTEAPLKRVRAFLKKQKLHAKYGLLHDTDDLTVRAVIGRSYAWLPPQIPPEYDAALQIESF